MISLLEIADRAYSGPRMNEKEWNLGLFQTMQKLVTEYNLAYTGPEQYYNVDDDYVDRAFQATIQFLTERGTYCISTNRVIKFTEDEISTAVKAAPSQFIVGTGQDARIIHKREIEDQKRVNVISGGHCPWPLDIAPMAQAAYARVQYGDIIEGFNFTNIDGYEVHGLPIALYAARREAAVMREAVRMAGRPGMAFTLYPILTKSGPLVAPMDPDVGLRRTDGLLLSILPDMKVEADYIATAIAYEGYGGFKVNGGCFSIIGGFCGGIEGAMIETIAKAITAWIVYRDVFQYDCGISGSSSLTARWTPLMESEERKAPTFTAPIWPTYVINRALAKYTNIIRFGGFSRGAGVGGIGSESELLSLAKHSMMSTLLGANLTCITGDNPTPYHVEFRAKVADAVVKANIRKEELPVLIQQLENAVKTQLKGKSSVGYGDRRMLAYKDFDQYFKPMKEFFNFSNQTPNPPLIESAKKAQATLVDLGIDLETAAIH
jgi:methylamine--corrinoid protein Co-methyltransferase